MSVNSAYLQNECLRSESSYARRAGEEGADKFQQRVRPSRREAKSTFLNYGKSFSKRILQGFFRQKNKTKPREKGMQRSRKHFEISR